jgi:tRNA/tmRNA/rRNA uracil-C5-methylase (TrmA/RlmC/RlmD family)
MTSPEPRSVHYRAGDELELTIEKIVPRGFGMGFAEGLTVMVPLAAVGDVLRSRIREVKKRLAFAEIVAILRPGPDRIQAPCPYFGVCGGCNFQHLKYQAQLAAKVAIVRDCLTRIGKIDYQPEIKIIGSPLELEYRSRVRWHLEPATQALGYMRRDSNEIVDIEVCPILTPKLQSTLSELRSAVDWNDVPRVGQDIEAVAGDRDQVSVHAQGTAAEAVEVTAALAGEEYSYTAQTFFQANQAIVPQLVQAAIGDATGSTALDLYSGVGLFTLPLGRRFARVVSVEGNARSVELAKRNLANAALTNVEVHAMGVARSLASVDVSGLDLVLLDPPRSGPEDGVISSIAAMRPKHVAYVSCEPAILARDLRQLVAAGFTIDSITALDLFPQTHHVETVVHLSA